MTPSTILILVLLALLVVGLAVGVVVGVTWGVWVCLRQHPPKWNGDVVLCVSIFVVFFLLHFL